MEGVTWPGALTSPSAHQMPPPPPGGVGILWAHPLGQCLVWPLPQVVWQLHSKDMLQSAEPRDSGVVQSRPSKGRLLGLLLSVVCEPV